MQTKTHTTIEFLKENWFKLFITLLLVMIYTRLGTINESIFQNTDISDSNSIRTRNILEDSFSSLDDSIRNLSY